MTSMDLEKHNMTCEEFQLAALDLDSPGSNGTLQLAAREHLRGCASCSALQGNWQDLRSELYALGAEDRELQAPSRVEMRLRQEFRTKHQTLKGRRNAVITAWAMAAAAVLIGTFGWINWSQQKNGAVAKQQSPSQLLSLAGGGNSKTVAPAGPELGEILLASNNSEDFTLLPGTMPGFLGDATVVHVQMQRGTLGALGLTVNEEHAGDWIQVDLLFGDDGQPQAVRLPQSEN
jgi:hypothetical protein